MTVLERGRRWPTGPNAETFPHVSGLDKRVLWYGTLPEAVRPLARLIGTPLGFAPYTGLLEPVLGENILSVCAAGVGGGSLVYQGMTLQPSEAVFNTWLPEGLDYRRMDRVHYPRVARMLKAATAPDQLIDSPNYFASRVFGERVRKAGYGLEKIPMPIDWDYALAELRGDMKPSYTNGDCALGVNNGGKHSVDVTYLKQAEATGKVTVATHHNVTSVARAADGRWEVHVDRTDDSGTVLEQKVLTTRALIMAAYSVNTSKLLVRAGATGAVPDLPDGLGEGWGTNGDRIYAWTSLQEDFGGEQGGPVVYGSKDWADPATANTVIQASSRPWASTSARPCWWASASAPTAAVCATTRPATPCPCTGPRAATTPATAPSISGSRRSPRGSAPSSTPTRWSTAPGTHWAAHRWAPCATWRDASRGSAASTSSTARSSPAPPAPATPR